MTDRCCSATTTPPDRNSTLTTRRTPRQTAAQIRKALRAAFPDTTISLTLVRGTASGWMDARWTDGPTTAAVDAVVEPFRSSSSDGMDDSAHRIPGRDQYTCAGVLTHREYSAQARDWAQATIATDPARHVSATDWHVNGRNYGAEHRLLDPRDLTTIPPEEAV